MPLPFFFLFPFPLFFLVVGFFPCFGLPNLGVFVACHLWQVICTSPPRLSPIATFLSVAFSQISSEPIRLIIWRFISLFLFCFPLYFVFVCSPYFLVLVFPCIILSLFVLCVLYFCSSADLRRVSFAVLHLLTDFILRPPTMNFKCTFQWLGSA